jgi:hypothetical protein
MPEVFVCPLYLGFFIRLKRHKRPANIEIPYEYGKATSPGLPMFVGPNRAPGAMPPPDPDPSLLITIVGVPAGDQPGGHYAGGRKGVCGPGVG